MFKKTLVGAGLVAALMIPSGAALAQPWDGSTDQVAAVDADQDRDRIQLHEPGECTQDGDAERNQLHQHDGDRVGDGERNPDRDPDQRQQEEGQMGDRQGPGPGEGTPGPGEGNDDRGSQGQHGSGKG